LTVTPYFLSVYETHVEQLSDVVLPMCMSLSIVTHGRHSVAAKLKRNWTKTAQHTYFGLMSIHICTRILCWALVLL